MQMGALEHDVGNDAEHCKGNALLDDLQLDEVEGATIFYKAQAVGRHLAAVLEEGDAPGEDDYAEEGPVAAGARFL